MTISTDENVLGFEIAVNHAGRVQSLYTFDDFGCVESSTVAAQSAPSRKLSCKITTGMEILRVQSLRTRFGIQKCVYNVP